MTHFKKDTSSTINCFLMRWVLMERFFLLQKVLMPSLEDSETQKLLACWPFEQSRSRALYTFLYALSPNWCPHPAQRGPHPQLIVFWWDGSWWNDFSFSRRFFCHLWMSLRWENSKYLVFYFSSDIILNCGWLSKVVLFHWVLVWLESVLQIIKCAFGIF